VDLIKRVKPKKALMKKGHPAKQVFQALRMEVNQELQRLEATLKAIEPFIVQKGRIAVISFHSTEDRLVKSVFRSWTVVEGDRHGPALRPQDIPQPLFAEVKPYPMKPSLEEKNRNPRSESATLRVVERVAYAA
jgi:16S rRNA (cytosine1402-N4)-methyltransferase